MLKSVMSQLSHSLPCVLIPHVKMRNGHSLYLSVMQANESTKLKVEEESYLGYRQKRLYTNISKWEV